MSEAKPPLFLDGVLKDAIRNLPGTTSLLSRDPFAEVAVPDPFHERLEALLPPVARLRSSVAVRTSLEASGPLRAGNTALPRTKRPSPQRRRGVAVPRLSELEHAPPEELSDRLLGEAERRRITALTHLLEGGSPYDRYGFSPSVIRRIMPLFLALYRSYFRVRSSGHAHLPAEGPGILVANHGGLLPFDAAMTAVDVLLHTDPPRLLRCVVDRWAGALPWINILFARLGQVVGTRENFNDLLADEQIVMVFPEGIDGIRKPITQRYRLQSFRTGFIELALRQRAPIVPVAILGSDDQSPILFDLKSLARRLKLPTLPITPTFPLLGPLGLLPYPVRYRILYGEPLPFHERFGPEGAEDPRLVRTLANQVRRIVQGMLDRR